MSRSFTDIACHDPLLLLAAAIVLEVCGTTSMKLSAGLSRTGQSVLLFVLYCIAFTCLTLALARIEIGVAYAIWSGVGTALIACIGVACFGDALTPLEITSLLLMIAGVVGLNLGGQGH